MPPQFGPSSKFGSKNPLQFFNLLQPGSILPHHRSRHKLGFGHRSPTPTENPLPFFSLLPSFTTEHPTHNRGVCHWNRGGKNIYNRLIELWKAHPPALGWSHRLELEGVELRFLSEPADIISCTIHLPRARSIP